MGKINEARRLVYFFLIGFFVVITGCEMPWDKATSPTTTTTTTESANWGKYAGTYKGTIRYSFLGYPEEVSSITFAIGSNGKFKPGSHLEPTIFLKVFQDNFSIFLASSNFRGSLS